MEAVATGTLEKHGLNPKSGVDILSQLFQPVY